LKYLLMLALLMSPFVLAQKEGDTKTVGDKTFTYVEGIEIDIDGEIREIDKGFWIDNDVPKPYVTTTPFVADYEDKRWEGWYDNSAQDLKTILDLGPNILFHYRGSDGLMHSYLILEDAHLLPWWSYAVTGVVIGGLIIDNNSDTGSASPIRP